MKIRMVLIAALFFQMSCTHLPGPQEQLITIERATGLRQVQVPEAKGVYLGKDHRGYEVLVRFEMGDLWGRYAARVAMGEAGRELGGVWRFLTGSYEYAGTVVGSPLDRLLSSAIGQPVSMFVVLKHRSPHAPRIDILSPFSTLRPYDPVPKYEDIGFSVGAIYSDDAAIARQIMENRELVKRLKIFRSQYIRVDDRAATFTLAGSENEYSGTIRNAGGYEKMLNAVMDTLADIADELK